jgi:hypothetical protein
MQSPAVSGGGGMAYLNRVDIGTGVIEFHLVMPRGCPHGNGGNGSNAQWAPNKDLEQVQFMFNASPSCWEVTFLSLWGNPIDQQQWGSRPLVPRLY